MKVRSVVLAFVSALCFAGLAANPVSTFAASPVPATRMVEAGFAALQQGDATKAVPLFTQSIDSRSLAPDALANALYNRGLAYQTLGQGGNAVDDYSAALNLDAMPTTLRARVLYNRGLAQQQLGRTSLAIEDFTSALLIDATFSYAYLARANALRDSGQLLFSISDYDRAVKYQHPEMAQVYLGEGLTFEALKRPVEAKRLYHKALSLQPNLEAASSRLNALANVAETDEQASDPVLGAKSMAANPTAQTEVVAQTLPKAVEPPAALLAVAQPRVAVAAPVAAAPKVVVASVPKVPVPAASAKPAPSDAIETASTAPAVPVVPVKAPSKAVAAAPVAKASGWAVQISSASTEDSAWSSFKTMQKSHKVLGSVKPSVVEADLGAKGTVYRVRLQGFAEQSAAQSACAKLKAGGVACFVAKTEG